jgi:DNA-binding GntR family transcriptional regulator
MDVTFAWQEQRTTTPEGVYRVLRAAILDGSVRPGGQLREAHIAADLGISRSPLREALSRLEEEGLVAKIPFRGAFVAQVSDAEVAEIAAVRLRVEPFAGELSMEALRGRERPALMQTIEDLGRATDENDIPASIDAHLRFHRLFYDLSGNSILQELWGGWENKLRLYLAVDHRSYGDVHEIVREHEGMVRCVLDGDVDGFRLEVARHFPSALAARDGADQSTRQADHDPAYGQQ